MADAVCHVFYYSSNTTYCCIIRFLLNMLQDFWLDYRRPISAVIFRCQRIIRISDKWNYFNVLSNTSIIICCCCRIWVHNFTRIHTNKCLLITMKQFSILQKIKYKHCTKMYMMHFAEKILDSNMSFQCNSGLFSLNKWQYHKYS